MNITRDSTDRITVHHNEDAEEATWTGVRTGIPSRGFAAQRVSAAARAGGTLIRDDRFTHWPIRRVLDVDGEFYLCGPVVPGRTVREALGDAPLREARWLPVFLRALAIAADHEDLTLCNVTTSLLGDDGSVLLFNADLSRQINANLALSERQRSQFPYRPERGADRDIHLYQALAIAYHALAGSPVCPDSEAAVVARCHAGALEKPPLHVHRPELPPALCETLETGLMYRDQRSPELLSRIATLTETEALDPPVPEDEREARRARATERLEKNRTGAQRRAFWRNHRRTIIAAGLAAAVVIAGAGAMITNLLAPPATAGMGPREVAATYYRAWDELDHVLMEDTLARGVGRNTIREVTNVYVIDRVQMAQQWRSILMEAGAWLEAGGPDGRVPYGIDNLDLRLMSEGASRSMVRAEYDIWRPESVETADGATRTVAVRTRAVDELVLGPTRHGWEIVDIRTTVRETETVPVSLR